MWFTGIDWADDHHDIHALTETGESILQLHVAHSREGIHRLLAALERITGAGQKDQMVCVLETKQGLLITALVEAGFAVYPVNPKTVDRWRSPAGAKTDQLDAYLLAKVGRSDWQQLRRLQPEGPLRSRVEVAHPRSAPSDRGANAAGQSADGVLESVLSGGPLLLHETGAEK